MKIHRRYDVKSLTSISRLTDILLFIVKFQGVHCVTFLNFISPFHGILRPFHWLWLQQRLLPRPDRGGKACLVFDERKAEKQNEINLTTISKTCEKSCWWWCFLSERLTYLEWMLWIALILLDELFTCMLLMRGLHLYSWIPTSPTVYLKAAGCVWVFK